MSKYVPNKMMKNSRYKDFLLRLNDTEKRKIIDKISVLISENQKYCDKGNYKHLCNIFTSFAIYQMLLEQGNSKEQAFEVVSTEMWKYVEKGAGIYRKLFPKGKMLKFMGKMLPKMFAKGSGYGWKYTWHTDTATNDYLKFECNECIYAKIFTKYNVPELGPMFCHADDINYGQIPGIKFTRNHTLCKDGQDCDFLFERVK